jgi:hypothetical protein
MIRGTRISDPITATATTTITRIGKNGARAIEPTATTSSDRLAAVFENGSGLVFIATRVAAFAPSENSMQCRRPAGTQQPAGLVKVSKRGRRQFAPAGIRMKVYRVPRAVDERNLVGENSTQ